MTESRGILARSATDLSAFLPDSRIHGSACLCLYLGHERLVAMELQVASCLSMLILGSEKTCATLIAICNYSGNHSSWSTTPGSSVALDKFRLGCSYACRGCQMPCRTYKKGTV